MARNNVKALKGHYLVFAISQGDEPETFKRVLLMNTNASINFTQNIAEETVANLDDFEDPYDVVRDVVSRDCTVEGAGKLDARYVDEIMDYVEGDKAGQKIRGRFSMLNEDGSLVFSLTGLWVAPSITFDGPYKETSTASMSFAKAGGLVYAKAPVTP